MLFTWTRWLAKNKSQARKPYRRPASFRPQIEPLETRLAPASLTVTNLNDNTNWTSGDGSLRGEIAAAASGDTIVFQSGLTGTITLNSTNGTLPLSKNVTITGPGTSTITVSGGGSVQILSVVAGVTANISGLELVGGQDNGTNGGGGAIFNSGTLCVSNCTFENNQANHSGSFLNEFGGGAIENKATGFLALSSCVFQGNSASQTNGGNGDGGAVANLGTLVVSNSSFTNNQAVGSGSGYGGLGDGGAIFSDGPLTLISCSFNSNAAAEGGGAVYVSSLSSASFTVTVVGCTFTSNSHGAISIGSGGGSDSVPNATILTSAFSDNTTNGFGGAIADGGNLTVSSCVFTNNIATPGGGALRITASSATITDCSFTNNSAQSGGAIYWQNPSGTGIIAGCTFDDNSANTAPGGGDGGGIWLWSNVTLANDTFTGNTALYGAGAEVYSGTAYFNTCTLVDNFTSYGLGGGIITNGGAKIYVYGCIVDGNTDPNNGEDDVWGITSEGYNLYGSNVAHYPNGLGFTPVASDVADPGDNPKLNMLADNGGPTETMLPQAGSPAINSGDPSFISPPFTDQRGYTRVAGGRRACSQKGARETLSDRISLVWAANNLDQLDGRWRMEVRVEGKSGPVVKNVDEVLLRVQQQLQEQQQQWLAQLRGEPAKFADLEARIHQTFQSLADQVVAGVLAQVTAADDFAPDAKKK